jgi:16S rRNA processing protein RimM
VARAHGLRGEVVVELVTNRAERVEPGSVLHAGARTLTVASAHPHGGPGRWVVTFAEVRGRDQADALRGQVLQAAPLQGDDDTLWVHELVGAVVVEVDGTARGRVTDVQANPASDLLVLESGALVPLRFVVDQAPGRLTVDVPLGLFDL